MCVERYSGSVIWIFLIRKYQTQHYALPSFGDFLFPKALSRIDEAYTGHSADPVTQTRKYGTHPVFNHPALRQVTRVTLSPTCVQFRLRRERRKVFFFLSRCFIRKRKSYFLKQIYFFPLMKPRTILKQVWLHRLFSSFFPFLRRKKDRWKRETNDGNASPYRAWVCWLRAFCRPLLCILSRSPPLLFCLFLSLDTCLCVCVCVSCLLFIFLSFLETCRLKKKQDDNKISVCVCMGFRVKSRPEPNKYTTYSYYTCMTFRYI